MVRTIDHPGSRMARLSQAFWLTRCPGSSEVPLAAADIFRTFSASTTTMPWFLAMIVLCLWRKSLRASATPFCIRATRQITLQRLAVPRCLPDKMLFISGAAQDDDVGNIAGQGLAAAQLQPAESRQLDPPGRSEVARFV